MFVLLSLGRYLCCWTISPRGYRPPSASSLAEFIKYIFYRNLQFLNHVIIIKTQVLLPHT